MVPTTYVRVDVFPLTPNNKIDRNALPTPIHTILTTSEPPRPGVETTIATIWENVLGTTGIGRHDNFFDLGGHSLLATMIVSRLRDQLGVDVAVRTIFAAPTIAELAAEIGERESIAPGVGLGDRHRRPQPAAGAVLVAGADVVPPPAASDVDRLQPVGRATISRVRSTSRRFVGRSTGSSSVTNRCVPTSR